MAESVDTLLNELNINSVKSAELLKEMEKEGLPPCQLFMTPDDISNSEGLNSKVLWENTTPTQDFLAQTIKLKSADYKYGLLIYAERKGDGLKKQHSTWFAFGGAPSMNLTIQSTNSEYTYELLYRNAIYVSATEFQIGDALYSQKGTTSYVYNHLVIPLKIIGFKDPPTQTYVGSSGGSSKTIWEVWE